MSTLTTSNAECAQSVEGVLMPGAQKNTHLEFACNILYFGRKSFKISGNTFNFFKLKIQEIELLFSLTNFQDV